MAYDENGPWSPSALTNTGNPIITSTLNGILATGFPASKILLGLAYYGRSFSIPASSPNPPNCGTNGIGCPFAGGQAGTGTCAQTSGILFYNDIASDLNSGIYTVYEDVASGTSWYFKPNRDWVTFDSVKDLQRKDALAKSLCLGGTFVWSIDSDSRKVLYFSLSPFYHVF